MTSEPFSKTINVAVGTSPAQLSTAELQTGAGENSNLSRRNPSSNDSIIHHVESSTSDYGSLRASTIGLDTNSMSLVMPGTTEWSNKHKDASDDRPNLVNVSLP